MQKQTDKAQVKRMSTVTAIFPDRERAERAYEAAITLGCDKSDITVMMSDETRTRQFSTGSSTPDTELDAKAAKGTANESPGSELGGPVGGTMGTLAPVLAAAGVFLLLPGFGIIAAGPLAVALTAAGSVGLAGGIIGALTHWGIPADRTGKYEARVREGGILMGVETHSDEDIAAIKRLWTEAGAEHVES